MATMPFTPCTTDPCADVTVNILQTVFGPVIRNLTLGTDPSGIDPVVNVIATMMSYFNSGVLTVATLIVSFVTVMGVINTANDGEAFGKNWSSLWTPVRIVSGAAVLLPTGTGYSFIQLFVMMISLWAVGFANGTFEAGVKNGILAGTLQSISQQSGMGSSSTANKDFPLFNLREFASDYLTSAYCATTLNAVYKSGTVTGVATPNVARIATPDRTASENNFKIINTYEFKDRNSASSIAGGNAVCGTVNTYKYNPTAAPAPSATSAYATVAKSTTFDDAARAANEEAIRKIRDAVLIAKLNAVNGMMDSLDEWVREWPQDINQDNWSAVSVNRFNSIVDGAQSAMLSELNTQMNSNSGSSNSEFKILMERFTKNITEDGWAMAGGYYQRLSGIREEFRKIYSESPGAVTAPALRWLPEDAKGNLVRQSSAMAAVVIRKAVDGTAQRAGYSSTSVTDTANVGSIIPSDYDDIDIDQIGTRGNKVLNSIVGNFIQKVTETAIGADGNTDAIARIKATGDILQVANTTLHTVQRTIVKVSGLAKTGAAATSAIPFAGGVATVVAALVELVNVVLVDPIMEIVGWLDPLAFYFGIFLPSLPYTIFMIAVVGWLLAVLQTVFAAPLWAVMHMTPDRTFVGSQTQGYLMLLSLFMRPVLIIAALFAAMVLANPIILYVSKAFWAMRTANVSSAESIGFLVQFLTFKNWLIMYGMLLLPVVYMIFGLSNTLPDAILTWIGAGIKPLGETQATAEMRGGMERHGASSAARTALAGGGGRNAGRQAKIGNDKNGPDAGSDSAADNKPISDTGQAAVSTPADYVAPDQGGDASSGGNTPVNSSSESAHAASRSTLSSAESTGGSEASTGSSEAGTAAGAPGGGGASAAGPALMAGHAGHAAHSAPGTPFAATPPPPATPHAGTASAAGTIINAGHASSGAGASSGSEPAVAAPAGAGADSHSVSASPASHAAPPTTATGTASAGGAGAGVASNEATASPGSTASAAQDQGQPLSQKEQPVKASAKMFDQAGGEAKSAAG